MREIWISWCAVIGIFFSLLGTSSLQAQQEEHVTVQLVSEVVSIAPGETFWVGCILKMEDHWHTYWQNPGDSGLATKIEWELPKGFQAGEIHWPAPEWIEVFDTVSFGYEGEIMLLIPIQVAKEVPLGKTFVLNADITWLECKEICLPGGAQKSVDITISQEPSNLHPKWEERFEQGRLKLPHKQPAWRAEALREKNKVLLRLFPVSKKAVKVENPRFFFEATGAFKLPPDLSFKKKIDFYELQLTSTGFLKKPLKRLRGVVVSENGWQQGDPHHAWKIDVPIEGDSKQASLSPEQSPQPAATQGATPSKPIKKSSSEPPISGLPLALLFAFIGGLILNLMPCVLPVLSIKVLGFVKEAGEDRSKLLQSGLAFTSGVMLSFWTLAGVLLALRTAGEQVGWGFHLQSPVVVLLLSTLFFLIGLNLFGVFEIGTSLTAVGGGKPRKGGFFASFASGVLATIAATPCAAPFMGSAIGFTLSQPPGPFFLIFTVMGLGMATPYLLVSISPIFAKLLPKPGQWMESFKQFMGFPMMATVVWLLWVFGLQQGVDGVLVMTSTLLLVGFAAWIFGRWANPMRPTYSRVTANVLVIAIVLGSFSYAFSAISQQAASKQQASQNWQEFSKTKVMQLQAEGKPIFIDFTAAWCLSCQYNKKAVLHTESIEKKFQELGVVTLMADWTNRDAKITEALKEFNRNSVPLYVLYPGDPEAQPIILPEILTKNIVLEALAEIKQ